VVEDFLIEQAKAVGVDPQRWVFDICCENLPPADHTWLREADPQVYFAPWLYEHGSEWIMPYLKDL
jgi:hypothetical protein